MTFVCVTARHARVSCWFVNPAAIWSTGEQLFVRDYRGEVHTYPWPFSVDYVDDLDAR